MAMASGGYARSENISQFKTKFALTAKWIRDTMGIKNGMGEREKDGESNIAKNQRKGWRIPFDGFQSVER